MSVVEMPLRDLDFVQFTYHRVSEFIQDPTNVYAAVNRIVQDSALTAKIMTRIGYETHRVQTNAFSYSIFHMESGQMVLRSVFMMADKLWNPQEGWYILLELTENNEYHIYLAERDKMRILLKNLELKD